MENLIKKENEQTGVEKFKGGFTKMKESVKSNKKTWAVILCALVLIGAAVFLNVKLFADNSGVSDYKPVSSVDTSKEAGADADPAKDEDTYFAMALLNRTQAYDSAYETLVSVTTSTNATEESKKEAFDKISSMAQNKQLESNIETLVKAKGFKECIAVISDDYIDVIVKSDGLLSNEVAQIQEIVLKQTGIDPSNVTIIERSK